MTNTGWGPLGSCRKGVQERAAKRIGRQRRKMDEEGRGGSGFRIRNKDMKGKGVRRSAGGKGFWQEEFNGRQT